MKPRAQLVLLALTVSSACSRDGAGPAAEHDSGAASDSDAGDGSALDAATPADARAADAAAADADAEPPDAAQSATDAASASDDAGDAGDSGDASPRPLPAHTFVYAGGYGDDESFRVFEIDRSTLALQEVTRDVQAGPSPSYVCPSADGTHLYVANEDDGTPGVTVLEVDPATGVPTPVDTADAISDAFVFTSLSPDGKYLLAASYNGGNAAVFRLSADGEIDTRVDEESFGGGAQSHSIRVHPSGKWAFVPNKGLDSVAQFLFNASTGQLTANMVAGTFPTYDGPRHIAFSPDGALVFLIAELANELSSATVQADGTLRQLDHEPRLPPAFSGSDTGAHVLAHPSAGFVYGSNRGSDTIAVFSYDAQGVLTLIEHESTRGDTPRNFDIDPHGQFMVVANQGGSLAVFAIGADGELAPRGDVVAMPEVNSVAIVGF